MIPAGLLREAVELGKLGFPASNEKPPEGDDPPATDGELPSDGENVPPAFKMGIPAAGGTSPCPARVVGAESGKMTLPLPAPPPLEVLLGLEPLPPPESPGPL